MYKLKIIIASTRPTRKGPIVANWFFELAKKHTDFETELVDLAQINLPFLDEPEQPSKHQYTKPHTFAWSAKIEEADAFVIVTPEYNHGFPAPLKNALDFLYSEWNYKPVGIVSYGGMAAGTRSVQMLKLVTDALKMVSLTDGVNIASFTKQIENGVFKANEHQEKAGNKMMEELLKFAKTMKTFRTASS